MARAIAIFNQKGGVGKTTTAVSLGAYLAPQRKTLIIDFDPQANASSALGSEPLKISKSIYHGLLGTSHFLDLINESEIPNLHLIPSAPHLAGALIELVNLPNREYFLRNFVNQLRHHYDYVLIDLPPSLNLLTVNGLMAADEILIPVQAEYYSLEGIGQLIETINLIRENLRHNIGILGAFLTMYDKKEVLSREVDKNLRQFFPFFVFETKIPRSISLAEAPSFSKPISLYQPASDGAKAYERLAREILNQEENEAQEINQFGNFNI